MTVLIADQVASYPLSRAQQRLWILQQLTSCAYLYHIPVILPLSPEVDLQRIKQGWADVIRNEHVLRSSLSTETLSWTIAECDAPMEIIQFDQELSPVVDIMTDKRLSAFFLEPFNLEVPPLLRAGILSTPKQRFLIFAIHHILVDGWSVHLLIERLNQHYTFDSSVLPAEKNSYQEYVALEKEHDQSYSQHLEYWLQRLHNKPIMTDLITDNARGLSLSGEGRTLHYALNLNCVSELQQLARDVSCTLMQVILFGFSVLLNRFSGQDDVVVGVPVMGRSHHRWYKTIGLFVNTCLHAVNLAHDETVLMHLETIKQQLFSDLAHATLPFDEMIKALYARQQLDPKMQFNVLYNFLQMEESVSPIGHGAPRYCLLPISKFDLSLHVYAYPSHVDLFFEYSTDLYREKTMQVMADYFVLLLKTMGSSKNNSLRHWIWQLSSVELACTN